MTTPWPQGWCCTLPTRVARQTSRCRACSPLHCRHCTSQVSVPAGLPLCELRGTAGKSSWACARPARCTCTKLNEPDRQGQPTPCDMSLVSSMHALKRKCSNTASSHTLRVLRLLESEDFHLAAQVAVAWLALHKTHHLVLLSVQLANEQSIEQTIPCCMPIIEDVRSAFVSLDVSNPFVGSNGQHRQERDASEGIKELHAAQRWQSGSARHHTQNCNQLAGVPVKPWLQALSLQTSQAAAWRAS